MKESYPNTILIRHRKENKKKCSLEPIKGRRDCLFLSYPNTKLPDIKNYVLLGFEGKTLSKEDQAKGIILLDGTWAKASIMEKELFKGFKIERRTLPSHFKTAYPRKQTGCDLPEQGLASIEALYIAYYLLERDTSNLLDHYYWKEQFLKKNETLFKH